MRCIMSKKISFNVSMEQLEKAKKMYDVAVKHDANMTFDQFLEKLAVNAFDAQLEINEMNNSMNKMFGDMMETMGKDGANNPLKEIDSMVQEIFKAGMQKKPAGETSQKDDNNKKKN